MIYLTQDPRKSVLISVFLRSPPRVVIGVRAAAREGGKRR